MQKTHIMRITLIRGISMSLLLAAILTSCGSDFGKKVTKENIEVYYKDGITAGEAEQLADMLYRGDKQVNKDTRQKSIQTIKRGDTVVFRMVLADESKAGSVEEATMLAMANTISDSIFKSAPVNVELTDKRFKTLRSFTYQKISTADYGEPVRVGNIEVYCKDGFSAEHATIIAGVIDRMFNSANDVSFQADRAPGGDPDQGKYPAYVLRMVTNKSKMAELGEDSFKDFAKVLSDSAYNGAPLILELTDATFKPFKTITYDPGAVLNE
jgi:hypothetical protein